MIELIVSAMIAGTTLISTYIMGKRMMKNALVEIEDLIFSLPTTEEGTKLLYGIGATLGSGVRSGIGIQKGRGKFSFMDLIGQIAAGWAQNNIPALTGEQNNPTKSYLRPLTER